MSKGTRLEHRLHGRPCTYTSRLIPCTRDSKDSCDSDLFSDGSRWFFVSLVIWTSHHQQLNGIMGSYICNRSSLGPSKGGYWGKYVIHGKDTVVSELKGSNSCSFFLPVMSNVNSKICLKQDKRGRTWMTFSKFAHRNFILVFMPLNGQPPPRCLTMTSGNTKKDTLFPMRCSG